MVSNRLLRWFEHLKGLRIIGIILVTLLLLMAAQRTDAHAMLIKSEPADQANLADAPAQVRLWFSEDVAVQLSSVQLMDENGQEIRLGFPYGDPQQPNLMTVDLPTLGSGVYTVSYEAVSKMDGHSNIGAISFGIGKAVAAGSAQMGMGVTKSVLPGLISGILLRWINYIALACLVGVFAISTLVLSPSFISHAKDEDIHKLQQAARHRVMQWGMITAAIAILAGLGLLVWQILDIFDKMPTASLFFDTGRRLLLNSRWGVLWLVRMGLEILVLLVLWRIVRIDPKAAQAEPQARIYGTQTEKSVKRWLWSGVLLAAVLMVFQSLASHAAAVRPNPAPAVALDAIHLLSVGAWLGGLLGLRIGLTPLIRRSKIDYVRISRATWSPFSIVAAMSVGILLATGLFATGEQVASLDALLTTSYGRLLLAKIAFFLMVGFFGLLNSMMLHPELFTPIRKLIRRPAGWSPVPLSAMPVVTIAESSVGLAVLFMVGYLVANPTANGPEYRYAAIQQPNPIQIATEDLNVSLEVQPNQPGSNAFTVKIADAQGAVPADILRVILHFKYLGAAMGDASMDATLVEPGVYSLQGNEFSMVGPWGVDVVVRRKGVLDSTASYNWIVSPVGQARLVSNRDWQPALMGLGAGLLGLIFLVLVGGLLRTRSRAVSPQEI